MTRTHRDEVAVRPQMLSPTSATEVGDLLEGCDVTVPLKKRTSISNISVLSNSEIESKSSGLSKSPTTTAAAALSLPTTTARVSDFISTKSTTSTSDAEQLASDEIGSKSKMDLLEETERLLAKLKVSTDENGANKSGSSNGANHTDEDADELNLMLEKAGHLSSMMQSISENIAMNAFGASSISVAHSFGGGGVSGVGAETPSIIGKRDPDGSSISDLQHSSHHYNYDPHITNGSPPADLTPTTADDGSSKRSLRQDPPGSVVGSEGNVGEDCNHKLSMTDFHNNSSSTPMNYQQHHQKPTSSVHLNPSMMDDDVSSVGSASFRPYGGSYHKSGPSSSRNNYFSSSFTHPEHPDEHNYNNNSNNNGRVSPPRDDLLGIPPRMSQHNHNSTREHPHNPYADHQPVDSIPEANIEPVCLKIPPTDLRANFDVVETSSRRDASEGAVQWEKVTTASPGEDDYVPLVDYSHIRPSSSSSTAASVGGGMATAGSRLELLRRRNLARQKRRKRALLVGAAVFVVAALVYAQFFRNSVPEEMPIIDIVEEPMEIFKTYDTTLLLQDAIVIDGYCFEALSDDPSLVLTFPKFIKPAEPEVEEKPKRGLFGRRRRTN